LHLVGFDFIECFCSFFSYLEKFYEIICFIDLAFQNIINSEFKDSKTPTSKRMIKKRKKKKRRRGRIRKRRIKYE
jgi:hypothetical protein